MSGITITRRDDLLIAVKRATPEGRERRTREAQLLARLDHPGVVQFIELVHGDPTELHMAFASSDSWLRVPPTTTDGIVDGLAAVAATVADLHDLGTTHGSLLPEHVLVTAHHRPVLCGLADAETANPVGCATDVASLGKLITFLLPGAPPHMRIELELLATRAIAGDLSARELTAELNLLRSPERGARRRHVGPRIRVSRLSAGASGFLLLLVVVGVWFLAQPGERGAELSPEREAAAVDTAPAATSRAPAALGSVAPPPSSSGDASPAPLATESITPEVGASTAVVIHENRRYGLGQLGDITVVGDWDCDETVTPALLQHTTGLVAIFSAWPEEGGRSEPSATHVVANATDLVVESIGGCDRLRVIHPSGSTLFTSEIP